MKKGRMFAAFFNKRPDQSDIEQEVQNIAVLDDVFLAFRPHFSGFLCSNFPFVSDKIVEGNSLSANESAFEIGVNHTCCLRRRITDVNCPGAGLP